MIEGRRRRLAIKVVIVVFVFAQLAVPAGGLILANANDRGYPFSWHMFSRVDLGER